VLVDNTPNPEKNLISPYPASEKLNLISLGDNMGIAYAHNIGIEWAHDHSADYVLLLDQDSVPCTDMVKKLMATLNSNAARNLDIAAAGPAYEDPRTGHRSYFMVSQFGIPYRYKPDKINQPSNLVVVNFLISSGTLIPIGALLNLGGKRSNYFIDHVDTEWCLRARASGFSLLGVHDALMMHSLGDKVKRVWLFYTRSVAYHSSLRDYYMFRNTLLLLRDVKMSVIFQLFLLSRLLQFATYFLIFASDRRQRLRCMLLGLYHGIQGIGGRFDIKTGLCTPIPLTKFDPK
jgi:rhamnosyltransferase